MTTPSMTAGQAADHVRAQHRQELADLHRALFSERGERQDGGLPLRLDGPSVTDRSVLVTVLASILSGAPGEQGAPPAAAALQVTVSGHRRSLGSRARLPAVEEEGWARAVLGAQWEALAYHQGLIPSFGGVSLLRTGSCFTSTLLEPPPMRRPAPTRSCASSGLPSTRQWRRAGGTVRGVEWLGR